jgi:hypothetical protein
MSCFDRLPDFACFAAFLATFAVKLFALSVVCHALTGFRTSPALRLS